jgi:SPP1 gp7 family putative phage head morphogenesis protein
MSFIFGRGGGRRNPLTPEEFQMAQNIFNAMKRASNQIKIEQIVEILSKLDPDALRRLMDKMSTTNFAPNLEKLLMDSIGTGGDSAISELKKIAPKIAIPLFIPDKVYVSNGPEMANMDFSKVPQWASPTPPKVNFSMSFNKTNPNSLAYAQRRAGQLVTSIDEMTRLAVNKIITEAFRDQIDYKTTAMRIKNVVGLHPKWADAVVKFENREMARLLKMGISEAKARISAQARAAEYADQLRSARATMIARTEIQIAQNEGRYEGWKQAADNGYVDPATQKMWITAKDERTCDVCGPMDGETVSWDGLFSIGDETPGRVHPNCRCAMVLIPPDRGTK